MTATQLQKYLEPYRKLERKEHLAAIIDDPPAIRFLSQWGRVKVLWVHPADEPQSESDRWRWLWSTVQWDRAGLARAARLSESAAGTYAHSCSTSRIIYPDGSISKPAEELIAAFTQTRYPGRKIGGPRGRKIAKPKDE